MARDNFSKKVVDDVAKRAGYLCSNPGCRRRTIGPSESEADKHTNIGKAAHITAASLGGPRYEPSLTPAERKSIKNAIHLCSVCADLIDKNKGVDFPIEILDVWKANHENEIWNELNNPILFQEGRKDREKGVDVLGRWNQQLSEGVYKSHFEIVELFCRHIIPFVQKHPDFQLLIAMWKKEYEAQIIKNDTLQKEVLKETTAAFQKIIEELGDDYESVKSQIEDIKNILNGKPGRKGYTSWPHYREAYWAVKELLQSLFDEGKTELCACYAIFDKRPSHVEKDGKFEQIEEVYISEFTFSLMIEEAVQAEKEFKEIRLQDPIKIWSYFETALYFWCMSNQDIRESLEYLRKVHPLRALSQKAAWLEINQAKRHSASERRPQIFTTELFREGLRTIINEVILANV